jgi:N-methylhydantoinase B
LSDPPKGIFGGDSGSAGSFQVNGKSVQTQNRIKLEAEDVVRLELPGGGGYGES